MPDADPPKPSRLEARKAMDEAMRRASDPSSKEYEDVKSRKAKFSKAKPTSTRDAYNLMDPPSREQVRDYKATKIQERQGRSERKEEKYLRRAEEQNLNPDERTRRSEVEEQVVERDQRRPHEEEQRKKTSPTEPRKSRRMDPDRERREEEDRRKTPPPPQQYLRPSTRPESTLAGATQNPHRQTGGLVPPRPQQQQGLPPMKTSPASTLQLSRSQHGEAARANPQISRERIRPARVVGAGPSPSLQEQIAGVETVAARRPSPLPDRAEQMRLSLSQVLQQNPRTVTQAQPARLRTVPQDGRERQGPYTSLQQKHQTERVGTGAARPLQVPPGRMTERRGVEIPTIRPAQTQYEERGGSLTTDPLQEQHRDPDAGLATRPSRPPQDKRPVAAATTTKPSDTQQTQSPEKGRTSLPAGIPQEERIEGGATAMPRRTQRGESPRALAARRKHRERVTQATSKREAEALRIKEEEDQEGTAEAA